MSKVIVTGAGGFLGNYLVKELAAQGEEIWAVVRHKSQSKTASGHQIHVIACDFKDYRLLPEIIPHNNYDCFYHLAWAGSSGSAREDYSLQLDNAKACADAAYAAASIGCRKFAGAGSIAQLMYGRYLQSEGKHPQMAACYGTGKTAAEHISRCVCEKGGIEFLWGYLSNFYGAGDNSSNIVNYLIQKYLCGQVPSLTDGSQRADFLYVSDAARALAAMGRSGRAGAGYYIGYGQPGPLKDFVVMIRDRVNPHIHTGLGRREFHGLEPAFESIDIGRLRRDTGFVPGMPFAEGIEKTIAWIKNGKEKSRKK